MTRAEREQMREVCRWNRTLVRENARLRGELARAKRESVELRQGNTDLRVQLAICDRMLGAAMDRSLAAQ